MKYLGFLLFCLAHACLAIPTLTQSPEGIIESVIPIIEDEEFESKNITIERTENIIEDFSIEIITNTTHAEEPDMHHLSRRGKTKRSVLQTLHGIQPRCIRGTRPFPRKDHEVTRQNLWLWCDLRDRIRPGESHLEVGGNGGVVYFLCNINNYKTFFCNEHAHELEVADKQMDKWCGDDRGAHLQWKTKKHILSFGRVPKEYPIDCAELHRQWRDIR